MKNPLQLLFIYFGTVLSLTAQTELKISPMQLLWSDVHVGAEFALSEDFGLEPRILYDYGTSIIDGNQVENHRFGVILEGKYYFAPKTQIDGVYAGMYTKYRNGVSNLGDMPIDRERFALGFLLGYKWVSSKNIVAELGFGLGRAVYDKLLDGNVNASGIPILRIDAVSKVAIGYRFPAKSAEERQRRRR